MSSPAQRVRKGGASSAPRECSLLPNPTPPLHGPPHHPPSPLLCSPSHQCRLGTSSRHRLPPPAQYLPPPPNPEGHRHRCDQTLPPPSPKATRSSPRPHLTPPPPPKRRQPASLAHLPPPPHQAQVLQAVRSVGGGRGEGSRKRRPLHPCSPHAPLPRLASIPVLILQLSLPSSPSPCQCTLPPHLHGTCEPSEPPHPSAHPQLLPSPHRLTPHLHRTRRTTPQHSRLQARPSPSRNRFGDPHATRRSGWSMGWGGEGLAWGIGPLPPRAQPPPLLTPPTPRERDHTQAPPHPPPSHPLLP